MSAGVLLAIAVAAIAVGWVVAPLFRADAAEAERVGAVVSEVRDLSSRREMLLAALKDLEDDRATDKIDEADYDQLHARLSAEAVEIMKQLDAVDEARDRHAPVGLPARHDADSDRA